MMLAQITRRLLQAVIMGACLLWAAWWFVSPEDPASLRRGIRHVGPLVPGAGGLHAAAASRAARTAGGREARAGSVLIFQTVPFVVVAILSFAVLALRSSVKAKRVHNMDMRQYRPAADHAASTSCYYRWRHWFSAKAYPVYIGRPFGVLTVAELLAILAVVFVVLYHFGRQTHIAFARIDANTMTYYGPKTAPKPWEKLHYAARYSGTAAVLPFSLLWIPVSRGSPLLRLVGVPFERAVRYHMWLAILMMGLLTFHSIGYILYYVKTNQADKIYGWATGGSAVAVLPGLLALTIGLIIWAISIEYFRRRFYNMFFIVHHLYIPFFMFWLYHVIWTYNFFIIPVLLFVVDRFIRMVQSRRLVDVIRAKVHESGAVELTLPIDQCLFCNALSKWCIGIPGLSRLQWHFFSTFSITNNSPGALNLKGAAVSFIIKPRGGWTNTLRHQFHIFGNEYHLQHASDHEMQNSPCHRIATSSSFSFRARVEGPYGDESDFYLKYERLILVGGGIGISPLLAIIQDILQRYRTLTPNCTEHLPKTIVVYHCIRKPNELGILSSMDPHKIFPGYGASGLDIKVHAYVTSKNMDDYSGMEVSDVPQSTDLRKFEGLYPRSMCWPRVFYPPTKVDEPRGISSISTGGKIRWVASTTIASIIGYFVLFGLANTYIIESHDKNISNYNRAHLVVACMMFGTIIFGGFIVLMWFSSILLHSNKDSFSIPRRTRNINSNIGENMEMVHNKVGNFDGDTCGRPVEEMSSLGGDVHFRSRPDWREVFDGINSVYQNECIGVLVFGPQSMQEDIARECRRNSCLNVTSSKRSGGMFHYHAGSAQF